MPIPCTTSRPGATSAAPGAAGAPPAAFAALRVLVVEDDAIQCQLICAALRGAGVHHIVAAAEGWAALAHLAGMPYDLVLSDLCLPGMDGIEFLHRAVQLHTGGFAILSAAGIDIVHSVEEGLAARGARMLGLLAKPLSMNAIVQLLHRCAVLTAVPQAPARAAAHPADAATLRAAVHASEFIPYYQPKIDLATGKLLGVEVLARWRRPGAGVLGPEHFIAAMEETPLIDTMTDRLLAQALADAGHWCAGPLGIAVNLAPHSLLDAALPARMLAIAHAHGVAPGRITL